MLTNNQKKLIEKTNQIKQLQEREERYAYLGILSEYQLNIGKKLQYKSLNPYQHFLFKRVLHGYKLYTKEELSQLHWDKKRRIKKVWSRGQKVLNHWKQTICNQAVNNWMKTTFGNDAKGMWSIPADEIIPNYNNILTLKDLGITYEDVILKFISEGLLPKNFLSLQNEKFKKTTERRKSIQKIKV